MKQPAAHCRRPLKALIAALRDWFSTPAGMRLAVMERRMIMRLSQDIFGYQAIQVHDFGVGENLLEDCPVKQHWMLDLGASEHSALLAIGEQLPVATDSVDLVLLPHSLDFAIDPYSVVREVERVLIPEGRVLIVGFNPISLWGLYRLVLRWQHKVPWCGHFVSYRRVVDWLALLGFDVEQSDVAAFSPPFKRDSWAQKMNWFEKLGRRVWPMFAGIYAIRAVKRVSTVRPIKMPWRGLRVLRPSRAASPVGSQSVIEKRHEHTS